MTTLLVPGKLLLPHLRIRWIQQSADVKGGIAVLATAVTRLPVDIRMAWMHRIQVRVCGQI
jgi:hypothetical protein